MVGGIGENGRKQVPRFSRNGKPEKQVQQQMQQQKQKQRKLSISILANGVGSLCHDFQMEIAFVYGVFGDFEGLAGIDTLVLG